MLPLNHLFSILNYDHELDRQISKTDDCWTNQNNIKMKIFLSKIVVFGCQNISFYFIQI